MSANKRPELISTPGGRAAGVEIESLKAGRVRVVMKCALGYAPSELAPRA